MPNRPTNPKIDAGMQAALDATRPMRPFQKHALVRALAMHMPDAADVLFALADVETNVPGREGYNDFLGALDKAFTAYFRARENEHAEWQRDDPFDYGFQEARNG